VPLWDVVKSASSLPDLGASAGKVDNFATMIKSFQTMLETHNAYDLAMHVAKQTGLLKLLYDDKSVEGVSRYENITELLNGIQEFVEDDESEKEKNLATFLEDVALYTDDQKDKDPDRDCVSLMTIHASKGLEYPVVFIVGIEENLFPSQLSLHSRADLEEERRLFYVAITRAETKCYMTFATSRFKYGSLVPCEPSRFIQEIDPQYLDMSTASMKSASPFGSNIGNGNSSGGYMGNQYASKKVEDKPTKTAKLFNVSKPAAPPVPPIDPNFVEGDISGLKVGDKVQHQRFGFGQVISIEGDASNAKAIVQFDQMGQKTLVLKFAKMRIL
jgi:DNA helicase-2/ATP-dependent DNA helicase PcrA